MELAARRVAQGVQLEPATAAAASAPMLQLDAAKAKSFLEAGLDRLGAQVPDLSQFAQTFCEQVPGCSA